MSRIIGSKTTAAQYNKMQEAEVGRLLLHLLDKPDDLVDHIKRLVFNLIMREPRQTANPNVDSETGRRVR